MPSLAAASPGSPDLWRHAHVGHWLRAALARFDARVLDLMARNPAVPLALSNLAARAQVGAAHIHITRHLPTEGARLTDLAQRAAELMGLPTLGGSDCHKTAAVGRCVTEFSTVVTCMADFIAAVRRGQCSGHYFPGYLQAQQARASLAAA